jgi:4-hydroxy-tetrahydrodipicolinate reductase
MFIKVGVIGAAGRMGSETCRAIEAADDLDLSARVTRETDLEILVESGCSVVVEFSTPAGVFENVGFCVDNGIHTVVGATGLTEDQLSELDERARRTGVGVFVAPNFALGAVLMMRFASQAARYFDWAEIIERHHEKKADAPSGTAARTAALMNDERGRPWSKAGGSESIEGVRGGSVDGVQIHSVRLPGSVAHQEVILGGAGETLTIRHDSLERSSFMPGVLMAIARVGDLRGVTVGLEKLLDQ